MKKHQPDWISGVFGLAFTAVGVALLLGNLRWADISTKAFWAFLIVALGLLIGGSGLMQIMREAGDTPDSDLT